MESLRLISATSNRHRAIASSSANLSPNWIACEPFCVPRLECLSGIAGQTLQLGRGIVSSSGGIKFGTNVQVTAQAIADNAQDATSIADIVRMLAGIASMSAAQNPQAAMVADGLIQERLEADVARA